MQEPRRVYREGEVAYTEVDDAVALGEDLGISPFPWQYGILTDWCACNADGKPTYVTCGLDVPRQNGKNAILEIYELYRLAVCGWHILHTAHRVKTAKKSFMRLVRYFTDERHPEIIALVERIRRTNGEEAIFLKNGASIEFIARTNGTARGFDDIQLVAYDEAQELTDPQYDAIAYTLAASSTGERQILYAGTPPNERSAGTVFPRVRKSILDGGMRRMCWSSWATEKLPPKDCTFADILDEIYESNPSMGYVLDEGYTESEFAGAKGNISGFSHERLDWWSGSSSASVIDEGLWYSLAIPRESVPKDGKKTFGVKFSPDGSQIALCACRLKEDGSAYVEHIGQGTLADGLSWLTDFLCTEKTSDTTAAVAVDGRNGAAALLDRLRDWYPRQALYATSTRDVVAATSMFSQALIDKSVTHWDGGENNGQQAFNESALEARKRLIGNDGGWAYGGDNSTPIEAAVIAYWAAKTTKRDPDGGCVIL
nr:terminase large subunit [uncultured phage]